MNGPTQPAHFINIASGVLKTSPLVLSVWEAVSPKRDKHKQEFPIGGGY